MVNCCKSSRRCRKDPRSQSGCVTGCCKGAKKLPTEKQGTSGVIQLFLPCVVSHKNLFFWLVCTCSVLEVHLFCKLTELCAFLCTSSGILWHILVVLLAWSSTQSEAGVDALEPKLLIFCSTSLPISYTSLMSTWTAFVCLCVLLGFMIILTGRCLFCLNAGVNSKPFS